MFAELTQVVTYCANFGTLGQMKGGEQSKAKRSVKEKFLPTHGI